MTRLSVALTGRGSAEVPAYGVADAEAQVEKEWGRAWPGARVSVLEVARRSHEPRIVEEFVVRYRVTGTVQVDAASDAGARRAALRRMRDATAETRFARVAWDVDVVRPAQT